MTISTGVAEVRSGQLHGLEARRVSLRCGHGDSTFFLLPGHTREGNEAALDCLWLWHTGRYGCECRRTGAAGLAARLGRRLSG